MEKRNELKNKLLSFWERTAPVRRVFAAIGRWIYHLRGLLMAVPVALAAIWLAIQNTQRLPAMVGINLLASGDYQYMIARSTAVTAPLVVTGVCLLLMFCSRKTVYPWLISIFTLAIPVLIYITNVFPA